MEEEIIIETNESACTICKVSMNPSDIYCPECGYPEKGTKWLKNEMITKLKMALIIRNAVLQLCPYLNADSIS